MQYVLVYEYVTCGAGRTKKEDPATKHPTYWLQGEKKTKPSVFPVDAIRRHVLLYHLCAASTSGDTGTGANSEPRSCGLGEDRSLRGGTRIQVWKHHYALATGEETGQHRDAYFVHT